MSIIKSLALAVLVGAISFGGGWYSRPLPAPEVITNTQIQEVEKVVTKTVKVKEKTPDGATKETTTTTVAQDSSKVAASKAAEPVAPGPAAVRPDWSVGLVITPRAAEDWYSPSGVEIGRRVFGDLWMTGSYSWLNKQATIGVRYEW
jgi:hypothetical protein